MHRTEAENEKATDTGIDGIAARKLFLIFQYAPSFSVGRRARSFDVYVQFIFHLSFGEK